MPFSIIPDRLYGRYTELTPDVLDSLGIRLLLCDLDYTLAPRRVERPDDTLRDWIGRCRDAGVQADSCGLWRRREKYRNIPLWWATSCLPICWAPGVPECWR